MSETDFAAAKPTDAAAIPVIDVSGAMSGQDIDGVGGAINKAATRYGFFYISGHGIAPEVLVQAFRVSRDFFCPGRSHQIDRRREHPPTRLDGAGHVAPGRCQDP